MTSKAAPIRQTSVSVYEMARRRKSRKAKGNKSRSFSKHQQTKRYLEFLSLPSSSANKRLNREIFRSAPNPVIKAVSNVALNALSGDVAHFNPKQKQLLAKHKGKIRILAGRGIPLARKRKLLVGGALPFLPIIIGSILGSVGERLFNKVF